MKSRAIISLYFGALIAASSAQEKKPAEVVKPASSKTETVTEKAKSMLDEALKKNNLLKQDGRNKEAVQKMWDEIKKGVKDFHE